MGPACRVVARAGSCKAKAVMGRLRLSPNPSPEWVINFLREMYIAISSLFDRIFAPDVLAFLAAAIVTAIIRACYALFVLPTEFKFHPEAQIKVFVFETCGYDGETRVAQGSHGGCIKGTHTPFLRNAYTTNLASM